MIPRWLIGLAAAALALASTVPCRADERQVVRFATFNASLNRAAAGQLARDLSGRDHLQARRVAEVVQRMRPHVLLLNEFDYDAQAEAPRLFQENYLAIGQGAQAGIDYPFRYAAEVNTGVPAEVDIDGDGQTSGPGDTFGFGRFAGQYGMVVYSMYPIELDKVRTFRTFLWKDMPGARLPRRTDGNPYYPPPTLARFRLSSKSLWDVPIETPSGVVHLLASHPTPPVFDGPEDRNGCRNHDEIRLAADYLDPRRSAYIYDDRGRRGGLASGARFVVAGDMNADPLDGDSLDGAIRQLTEHALVDGQTPPESSGAVDDAKSLAAVNGRQRGNPAQDTANFGRAGNLRVDYVLSSKTLTRIRSGVFWPKADEVGRDLLKASDHRLVWTDVEVRP